MTVQIIPVLIKKMIDTLYFEMFQNYLEKLDQQLENTTQAIRYIQNKKHQLQLMIDRQTIELENKYIDIMEQYQINIAQNIYCMDISKMKCALNEIENEYAQLENYVMRLNEDKDETKQKCHVVQALMNAY